MTKTTYALTRGDRIISRHRSLAALARAMARYIRQHIANEHLGNAYDCACRGLFVTAPDGSHVDRAQIEAEWR